MSTTYYLIQLLTTFVISQRVTFFSSPFTVDNVGWTEYNAGRSFQGGVITDPKCPSGTCEGMSWDDEVYQQISTTDYTNIEVEYSIRTDGPCEFWCAIGTWDAGKWTKEMLHAANSLPSDVVHSLPSDVDNIPIFVLDFWADTNEGEWCYLNHINVSGIPINPITPDPTTAPVPTQSPTNQPTQSPTSPPTNQPTEAPNEYPTESPTQYPTDSPSYPPTKQPNKNPQTYDPPTNTPTLPPTYAPAEHPTVYYNETTTEETYDTVESQQNDTDPIDIASFLKHYITKYLIYIIIAFATVIICCIGICIGGRIKRNKAIAMDVASALKKDVVHSVVSNPNPSLQSAVNMKILQQENMNNPQYAATTVHMHDNDKAILSMSGVSQQICPVDAISLGGTLDDLTAINDVLMDDITNEIITTGHDDVGDMETEGISTMGGSTRDDEDSKTTAPPPPPPPPLPMFKKQCD